MYFHPILYDCSVLSDTSMLFENKTNGQKIILNCLRTFVLPIYFLVSTLRILVGLTVVRIFNYS